MCVPQGCVVCVYMCVCVCVCVCVHVSLCCGDTQGTHSTIGICVFSVQYGTVGIPMIPRVST